MSQGRGHATNCLLCDLMWSLCLELFSPPEVCARPPVPTKRCSFIYRSQWFVCFLRSSSTQRITSPLFPISSLLRARGPTNQVENFYQEKRSKYKWNQIIIVSVKEQRNATSPFCFTQFLATENPHYTRGRGKASDPVGETESSKKNPAI